VITPTSTQRFCVETPLSLLLWGERLRSAIRSSQAL
jgi:hypothetical protein